MDGTMSPTDAQKKPILSVVDGGQSAARPAREARIPSRAELKLEREMKTVFGMVHGEDGNVPGEPFYKIRKDAHHPWRVMARRYIEMREKRAPLAHALQTLDVVRDWIVKDLYGDQPDQAA